MFGKNALFIIILYYNIVSPGKKLRQWMMINKLSAEFGMTNKLVKWLCFKNIELMSSLVSRLTKWAEP